MKKKKIYSFASDEKINVALPQLIKDAFYECGWNAFGVYELVKEILKQEKKEVKKRKS